MGRATRGSGPTSSRSDEIAKKTGQVRPKRKKRRRDLEEIRRNVLEAKRRTRYESSVHHKTKRKSNFSKVLANFADKRRENDDATKGIGVGKSTLRKSRRICERLLPEPTIGVYQNGAKGREIRKAVRADERKDARLRGNVLELLKGEETTASKSSWEKGEDAKNRRKRRKMEEDSRSSDDLSDSHESDCNAVVKYRPEDELSLLPANTKGVKRANGEKSVTSEKRNDTRSEMKDQLTELQRQSEEDKCRRRLFEPDDGDVRAENSFGIIDPAIIADHEIRFSPRETRSVEKSRRCRIDGSGNSRLDNGANGCENVARRNEFVEDFWGWSPATCYERLCAMICIENFENKTLTRQRGPDPIVKIRKALRGIFLDNCRRSGQSSSAKSETVLGFPSRSTITSKEEINQSLSRNLEECSSRLRTLVGSWQPENFLKHCEDTENEGRKASSSSCDSRRNGNETSDRTPSDFVEKTIKSTAAFLKGFNDRHPSKVFEMGIERAIRAGKDEARASNDKNVRSSQSSSEFMEKTMDSSTTFLKGFQDENRRSMFEMEIEKAARVGKVGEKFEPRLATPSRETKLPDNRCPPRRSMTKHVPTILRRSNDHSGTIPEPMNRKVTSADGVFPTNDGDGKRPVPLDEIPTFPIPGNSPEIEIPGSSVLTISPISIQEKTNFYRHRRPDGKFTEQRANDRKSKSSFHEKYDKMFESMIEEKNREDLSLNINIENFVRRDNKYRLQERMDFRAEVTSGNALDANRVSRRGMTYRDEHDAATKVPKRFPSLLSNYQPDNDDIPSREVSSLFKFPETERSFYRPNDAKSSTRKNLHAGSFEGLFRSESRLNSTMNDSSNEPRCFTENESTGWDYVEKDPSIDLEDSRVFRLHRASENSRTKMKKSVVVFRPIEENRRVRYSQCFRESRQDHRENSESTAVREAVKSLRVMTVEDEIRERGLRRSFPSECKKSHQRVSPSCRQRLAENVPGRLQSYESLLQPSKYLAYEQSEGRNPQRIPIYETSDSESISSVKTFVPETVRIIDQESKHPGTIFVRPEIVRDRNKPQIINEPLIGATDQNCHCASRVFLRSTTDEFRPEQKYSRRLALVHRNSFDCATKIASSSGLESTSNDIPGSRIVYYLPERKTTTLPDPCPTGDSGCTQHGIKSDFETLRQIPERIQLLDGRVGFLLRANSAIGDQPQNGCRCELARSERIAYSHSDCRIDSAHNEAYHRPTRNNGGVLDTFPGV